jgi:hypothetical protein
VDCLVMTEAGPSSFPGYGILGRRGNRWDSLLPDSAHVIVRFAECSSPRTHVSTSLTDRLLMELKLRYKVPSSFYSIPEIQAWKT